MNEKTFEKSPKVQVIEFIKKHGADNKLRLEKVSIPLNIEKNLFREIIKELKGCNLIEVDRHGRLISHIPSNSVLGTIYTTPTGAGFVTTDSQESYYIPKPFVKMAIHKDYVLISPLNGTQNGKTKEAIVLTVISHNLDKVVGTYMPSENNKYGFIISDDKRINFDLYVSKNYTNNAMPYDKVVALIKRFPNKEGKRPVGEIVEILGLRGEKETEQLSIIKSYDLPEKFPPNVMKESQAFDKDRSENWDLSHRTDYRDKLIVTIDCDTSKDLDDAISIERTENGYELGVYIADVAHYVREGTGLDKEAFERGNSVYLLDQVVPMLPPILSNNLCSLNPNEPKLTMALIMEFDENGTIIKHNLSESIIISKDRLNYTETTKYLSGDTSEFLSRHDKSIGDMLNVGFELSQKLFKKRLARGSVEFDIPETDIILDENGNCIDIKPEARGIANDLIEEFMLVANETIAKFFYEQKIPFVYRVHPTPFASKLENFTQMAESYGIECECLKKDPISPADLRDFLAQIETSSLKTPVKMLLLQSMQQARYSEIRVSHFGLASDYYCHFTSPIRRYPDLAIHRLIKMWLRKAFINDAMNQKYTKFCSEVSKQSSKTERVAERAEKEVKRNKVFEYISHNMNREYKAIIKSFNKVGIFIILENSLDGFMKDKSYIWDSENNSGSIWGEHLVMGQSVTVKAIAINQNTKEVLFKVVQNSEDLEK